MEEKKTIAQLLHGNSEYFRDYDIEALIQYSNVNDSDISYMPSLYNPSMVFIVSLFLGWLGIDRMMIGDIGYGILKFLVTMTLGWLVVPPLVLWIVDVFLIKGIAKDKNYKKIKKMLQ